MASFLVSGYTFYICHRATWRLGHQSYKRLADVISQEVT